MSYQCTLCGSTTALTGTCRGCGAPSEVDGSSTRRTGRSEIEKLRAEQDELLTRAVAAALDEALGEVARQGSLDAYQSILIEARGRGVARAKDFLIARPPRTAEEEAATPLGKMRAEVERLRRIVQPLTADEVRALKYARDEMQKSARDLSRRTSRSAEARSDCAAMAIVPRASAAAIDRVLAEAPVTEAVRFTEHERALVRYFRGAMENDSSAKMWTDFLAVLDRITGDA